MLRTIWTTFIVLGILGVLFSFVRGVDDGSEEREIAAQHRREATILIPASGILAVSGAIILYLKDRKQLPAPRRNRS